MGLRWFHFWPLLALLMFPPWEARVLGAELFLGHRWLWEPPRIHGADYTIAVALPLLLIEAAAIVLLVVLYRYWRSRKCGF